MIKLGYIEKGNDINPTMPFLPALRCLPARALQWQVGKALQAGFPC